MLNCILTHKPSLRAAIQCFLLTAVCNLTSSVGKGSTQLLLSFDDLYPLRSGASWLCRHRPNAGLFSKQGVPPLQLLTMETGAVQGYLSYTSYYQHVHVHCYWNPIRQHNTMPYRNTHRPAFFWWNSVKPRVSLCRGVLVFKVPTELLGTARSRTEEAAVPCFLSWASVWPTAPGRKRTHCCREGLRLPGWYYLQFMPSQPHQLGSAEYFGKRTVCWWLCSK